MINRRTLTTSGFAALVSVPIAGSFGFASQTTDAPSPFSGAATHQNLPELPTAPEGELAVVKQSLGNGEFVPVIYHNATDAAVRVTEVTATAVDAIGNRVDETSYGPIDIQAGQFGIAVFEFEGKLAEGTEIEVTLSTDEDAEAVDINVTHVEIADSAARTMVHMTVENPNDFDVDDVVIAGIFFTPEGEILSGIATGVGLGLDAGDTWNQSFERDDLEVSDSFVVVASGTKDS